MPDNLSVTHLVDSRELGDIRHVLDDLLPRQAAGGLNPSVTAFVEPGEDLKRRIGGVDVAVVEKPPKAGWRWAWTLAARLKQQRPAIIHTHTPAAARWGSPAARLMGRPCLTTCHSAQGARISSFIWNLNQFIVSVSMDVQRQLQATNHINPKKCQIVYNGIDLKRDSGRGEAVSRSALGIPPDAVFLASTGRFIPEEDQESQLKAVRKLRSKECDARLVVMGEGPLEERLKAKAKEFGIEEAVRLIPWSDHPRALIAACDIFLVTSVRHGRPVTILEAMAAGKPVIATSIGSNPEMIVERKTGYLVPCGYPERIDTAVMRLKALPNLVADIGKAARERVEELFTAEMMELNYRKLYERLASGS